YVEAAAGLGLKLAVASSSSRDWVAGHLDRLGLLGHFDVLKCSDDVVQVKPDPGLYRAVLDALGVVPHRAIALEDSPNGIAAAKGAGLFCVAVPNALTGRLVLDGADLRVPSLTELPLAQLLRVAARPASQAPGGDNRGGQADCKPTALRIFASCPAWSVQW